MEEQQCTAQDKGKRQKANENAEGLLCANTSPGVSTTDHISLSGNVNKRLLPLIHKTAWMDLKCIMLSAKIQSQKITHYMVSFI